MRTIKAPGIQLNEIDRSQYDLNNEIFQNTTTLVLGFADKGDDYDPKYIFSLNDFINTYGTPNSEAERYFYLAASEIFRYGGMMIGTKLPYDNRALNNYTYTTYKIDDNVSSFTSPFEIIYDRNFNLNKTLTLQIPISILSANKYQDLDFDVLDSFKSFISSNCNFDYSLTSATDALFGSTMAFHNLSCLLGNDFSNIVTGIDMNEYLTRGKLLDIIGEENIPSDIRILSNANAVKNSYFNFASSLSGLGNSTPIEPVDPSDSGFVINPGTESEIDEEKLNAIKEKFIFAGMSSYNEVINQFFKTLTTKEVSSYYTQISSYSTSSADYSELSDLLVPVSFSTELEEAFEKQFTGVPEAFENVKTYREIKSGEKSGMISINQLDSLKVGYSKPNLNEIMFVDITRGQYGRDEYLVDYEKNGSLSTNQYLGIMPVVTTAVNAMYWQNLLNTDEPFPSYNPLADNLSTVSELTVSLLPGVNSERFIIPLNSDNPNEETVGSMAVNYFPALTYMSENKINMQYLDQIGVVVFKIVPETSTSKVNFIPMESFIGSFDKKAIDPITKSSIFIDDLINNSSQYINFFSNVDLNKKCDTYLVSKQKPTSLGFYEQDMEKDISYDISISKGIDNILEKLQDTNRLPIDIVTDAGISNIAQFVATTQPNGKGKYTPEESTNGFKFVNQNSTRIWRTILKKFDNFCSKTRKDCIFVADGPRQLVLDGNFPVVRKTNLFKSVKTEILPYIKYLGALDSSYSAGYLNWFRCYDNTRNMFMWVPPSIKATGIYLNCSIVGNMWDAPAGLNRGRITDAYDVSFNPTSSEADSIYSNFWNYALSYPLDGVVLEGNRTFQCEKTALDRISTRRLMLGAERGVWMIARQYLYESLSERNISSFRDTVTEFLSKIKLNGGIKDFYVLCDGRNNTPETIENNELKCSIGIRPYKVAEYILLNFICTNQSANVEEVVLQNS